MSGEMALNPELDLREVAGSSDTQNQDSLQKRLCWVCFGTEQDDEGNGVIWICPCQCKGTMKWVHEECLQRWIDEKQRRTNSTRVSCSQCKTYYILSFPPVNGLIKVIEHYDKLLYGSSPFVAVSVIVGSIYWCCGSYGFISIIQLMGYEEGRRLIEESDPLLLVIGLPVIPLALILSKLIKWEDFILKMWSRCTFKIPRPLSYFIDQPPPQVRAHCDELLLDPGFNEPLGCTRMVCGALLLPTVSALVGKIFFSRIGGSQWRRSLIGGLAFLLLKGAMKIYFRKTQYIRYTQRSIKNYTPPPKFGIGGIDAEMPGSSETSNNSTAASGDDRDGDPHQDRNDFLRDHRNHDDSDDEGQTRTTRATFSMTIRL